mmetsp:Transcript_31196/g.52738  ORF Transcript_31196/g.52738 Transcript_31196/m.52738 type:complete len:215 (+) Transcript_31196:1291-1935(+)
MHPSVLHVLTDGIVHNFPVLGHSIELDFLGPENEFGDHHRMVLVDHGRLTQEVLEVCFSAGHIHGSPRQNVRGTHKARIAHCSTECLCLLQTGQLLPGWLVHLEHVKQLRKLLAVLCFINVTGRCPHNWDSTGVQRNSQIIGDLSSHGDEHSLRNLLVNDVEHALQRQLFEIQAVRLVKVSAHGFRVVIDHDTLVPLGAKGVHTAHGTPIEFDT